MRIRIKLPTHTRFYYSDVSIICDSNPPGAPYEDQPVVIVEVLSRNTRRTDEGEKRDAYFAIPSLQAYLLVEQSFSHVTVYRRSDQGFAPEVYSDNDEVIAVPEIGAELPLREVYEGVTFAAETAEDPV